MFEELLKSCFVTRGLPGAQLEMMNANDARFRACLNLIPVPIQSDCDYSIFLRFLILITIRAKKPWIPFRFQSTFFDSDSHPMHSPKKSPGHLKYYVE